MGIHRRSTAATITPRTHRTSAKIQILVLGSMLLFSISRSSLGAGKGVISVEGSELLGGASKVLVDSGQNLVSLAKAGQGLKLQGVPAGDTLAIRYASTEVGTISVAVNGGPACKVNVHSSGDATSSFLNAKIQMAVPEGAMVTISRGEGDVAINIQQITVGEGELGLPPDIWNLPELQGRIRAVSSGLEGPGSQVCDARVVARREIRGMGPLGSPIHARAGRLVRPRHVPRRQRPIQLSGPALRPSVGIRLQGHRTQLGDRQMEARRTYGSVQSRWGPNISWPWGRIMTILTAGIQRTSRGIPRTLAQRWTSSAHGRRSRGPRG